MIQAQRSQTGIPSGSTALISVIDTTSSIDGVPLSRLVAPAVQGVEKIPCLPIYSFVVENLQGRKVLFDLGTRKDIENLAPSLSTTLPKTGWTIKVEKGVLDILKEQGYHGDDFEAIVWSHQHWDHIGDASTFPDSVKIIVGPGFREEYLPGAPESRDSPLRESDYQGKEMIELDFKVPTALRLLQLDALDYFGDGSFFLLDAPGHARGHIMGLVRTTANPDSFILLGADTIHDAGELRPSEYLPVPENFDVQHYVRTASGTTICPGHLVEQFQSSRGRAMNQPLFEPTTTYNLPDSLDTIRKMQKADADEDIFIIFSHDSNINGIVDLFPKRANEWKDKGWAKKTKWAFLGQYLPSFKH